MGKIFTRTVLTSNELIPAAEPCFSPERMLKTLEVIAEADSGFYEELSALYKKSTRIYCATNAWFIIWSGAVLAIGLRSTNALTRRVSTWMLFGSIMHILAVAIMFFSSLLLSFLSLKPRVEQMARFCAGLGLHFLGSLANLTLLWLFTTNDWRGSKQQFACIGTVVPALLNGIMFAVLAAIYFQVKNYSQEEKVIDAVLVNSMTNV
eukprot:TRINITY_DN6273_c0_g1_i4.p1 TRINITY_DN6273_c0_g1~~TRINITY_DN6273_c0_g1_i4.p1  ORF type:complete len:207 (+),score=32.98 TRINITY_DN6273_c0_g1_i4:116-736(+)